MATSESEALRQVRELDGGPEHHFHGRVDHAMTRAVYVWEAPVRLWHWVTVVSMLFLAVTGYLIGKPLPSVGGEASDHYVMGYIRMVHFMAGHVFAIVFILRVYWSLVGNEWSKQLFLPPLLQKKFWTGLLHQVKWYLFLTNEPRGYVGHNPLANTAMFIMFSLVGLFMIFTGYALYAEGLGMGSWADRLFGWVTPLLGQSQNVHTFHRLGMWIMIIFSIVHMYMAFREDILSKQGVVSSMVNGYKYIKD